MFYAAKCFGNLAHYVVSCQAFYHSNCGHIVFHVVDTGNENVRNRKYRLSLPANHPIFQAHMGIPLPGEEASCSIAPEGSGNFIVSIEDQQALRILIAEDVFLRFDILIHVLVNVQMVGGQIGDQGPLRTAGHIHQLEGAELHYGKVLRLHFPHQGQQRSADIASQPYRFACCLEHFRNQGGSCGFAIRARYCNQMAGANLKKHFHLRSDLRAPVTQGNNCRIPRMHTWGTEYNIRFHTV